MFYSGLLKIVTIVTGIFAAGEVVALLIGMYVLSPHPNPWISGRNTFLIVVDILCGAGLLWLILTYSNGQGDGWLLTIVLVSLGAHRYREWEYFVSSTATPPHYKPR